MRAEYLLFDLAVAAGPLWLSVRRGPTFFAHRWTKALGATLLAAVPMIAWDALVTGRHWTFNHAHTLGVDVLRLPLEEWGFFFVVPFACVFTWEVLVRAGEGARLGALRAFTAVLGALLVAAGVAVWGTGREYSALSLGGTGLALLFDALAGSAAMARPRAWLGLAAVSACTLLFNNFLTARPVVLYDPRVFSGLRIVTMPVEDLGFGLALLIPVFSLYEGFKDAELRDPSSSLLGRLVRWRLKDYRRTVVAPDASKPLRNEGEAQRVAVVGGGIAGLVAACTLAERGFAVTVREKNDYLGGKLGGWTFTSGGETLAMDHGFHAFFRQYFNLLRFLARTGVTKRFRAIDDYLIRTLDGRAVSFAGTSTVPGINLLSLARIGLYEFGPVARGPAGRELEALLRYEKDDVERTFDGLSFDAFAARAELPKDLRLVFNTFARAFFSDGRRMSMAELIKGFHFYYLSNDAGLLYDFLDADYAVSFAAPVRAHLERHGGTVRLGAPVKAMARDGEGFTVDGERFDWVVVAADVPGTRAVLDASPELLAECPSFAEKVAALRPGQRYAVLRLWFAAPVSIDGPEFVITERRRVLDAMAAMHRVTDEARAWAAEHGGSVIELHCYALPDDVPDEAVRDAFLEEFHGYVPAAKGVAIVHERLELKRDFPAFHVGMSALRPGVETGVPRLLLAGDWVKLPWASMLMESACVSGLLAANAVLRANGLREELVEAVAEHGLLHGVPKAP